MDVIEIIGKLGFPVAVACYLLFQTKKDKEAVETRMNKLEEFCRGELLTTIKESTETKSDCAKAIAHNSVVVEKNTQLIDDVLKQHGGH